MKHLQTFERYGSDELADWQQRWDQLMMDMEQEAEPEGGDIANDYASRMEVMEKEKEVILSKQNTTKSPDEEDFDMAEKKYNYLKQHLNYKQARNAIDWVQAGRDKEFVKTRLDFYGIGADEIDNMIELLFEEDYLGVNSLVSHYSEDTFESIKRFNTFQVVNENDEVKSLDELYKMSTWIEKFHQIMENLLEEAYGSVFDYIESNHGENVSSIIDGMFSADKLHYHQSGRTVATGGIDTGEFIENFDEISTSIDSKLREF